SHYGQDGACHVHWSEKIRFDLSAKVLGRYLLEESCVKVSRVIDQHVDSPELLYRSLDRGLRIPWLRHVELYDQQIVRSPDHLRHLLDIPPRRDRLISRSKAAFAMSVPMPRPAPVINSTFPSFLSLI